MKAHIQHLNVSLPGLPAAIEGLRIAHLTDAHFFSPRMGSSFAALLDEAARETVDLVFLTGDFMDRVGHESHAAAHLRTIVDALHPRLGFVGVFGNHDTPGGRRLFRQIPRVHWLENQWLARDAMPLPDHLAIAGVAAACTHHTAPQGVECDGVALAASTSPALSAPHVVRLVLSHKHVHLPMLADLRASVIFSGHTHGGQCRSPFPYWLRQTRALVNSTDWPLHLTAGLMQHRTTQAVVSRGLGETTLRLRAFCPRQWLIVKLTQSHAPLADVPGVENMQPW